MIEAVDAHRGAGSGVHWTPRAGYALELQVARDAQFRQAVCTVRSETGAATLPALHAGEHHVRARWVADGAMGAYGPARRFTIAPSPWLLLVIPVAAALSAL